MTIQNFWPEMEKPREKLLNRGANALSDAELLAIFLRTGTPGKNVIELAQDIINHFGSIQALFAATEQQFCQIKGLGRAKFVQLQASLEMSLRHTNEQITQQSAIENPEQVKRYLKQRLAGLANEKFVTLFLNNQHQVLAYEELFFGTINASSVHIRVIVQQCIKHNAAAIIIAHNHPSGVAEPSLSDIDITQQIKSAMQLIDVRLLDHLIIASKRVVSLAEQDQI
jgi:DNA repair protein RadC